MEKWNGVTVCFVEHVTGGTQSLFDALMTGQTFADAGNGARQIDFYILIVCNSGIDVRQAAIEVFENGVCQLATGFVLVLFAENGFDLFEIKFHFF